MTNFKIKVDLADLLIKEVDKIKFKSKKSREYTIKLLAVTLHALYEEEADPFDYYKPLSASYIRDSITTHTFYLDYFLKNLQGIEGEPNFETRIFQTDGSYRPKYFEMHYRINPAFLTGPTKEIEIEIEFESLNELFPEIINHFNYSVSLIKPCLSRKKIANLIIEQSMQMGISANGASNGFFTRTLDSVLSLSDNAMNVPETIKINGRNGLVLSKSEINGYMNRMKNESGNQMILLVQEKNKKNKNKFQVEDLYNYLEKKRSYFLKRVNKGIDRILAGEWHPNISATNGRFNHRFTYIDKFCIDFFSLAGEEIASFDLRSSQPTILANLLVSNSKLRSSIKNSKYEKLKRLFEKNEHVFFKQNPDVWLEQFLNTDIYNDIANEIKISRGEAKREMMVLFFTEPGVVSEISKPMNTIFPAFHSGLLEVKKSFKKTMGSSKRTFPIFLQLVEAHIFLEVIYTEIAKARIPALTKHDCVLFPKSREKEISTIIKSCFEQLGFKGKMELEKKKDWQINEWPDDYKPSQTPID